MVFGRSAGRRPAWCVPDVPGDGIAPGAIPGGQKVDVVVREIAPQGSLIIDEGGDEVDPDRAFCRSDGLDGWLFSLDCTTPQPPSCP